MADDPFHLPPEHIEFRPNADASRLLMGGPVVLVTMIWKGKPNVLPLSWHMPLSSDPPIIGIAVEQSRYSADVISHAQAFALNFPKRPLLHHVQYLGSLRGEHIDKFEATQWDTFVAQHISAPLLKDCAGWIECEVVEVYPIGDHILFAGEVKSVRVDPASFDPEDRHWSLDDEDERPLHFLGGNHYSALDHVMEARLPRDFEAPESILRERITEELELTREARERREERIEALRDEVRRGNIVDLDQLGLDIPTPEDTEKPLDLSKGFVLKPPDED